MFSLFTRHFHHRARGHRSAILVLLWRTGGWEGARGRETEDAHPQAGHSRSASRSPRRVLRDGHQGDYPPSAPNARGGKTGIVGARGSARRSSSRSADPQYCHQGRWLTHFRRAAESERGKATTCGNEMRESVLLEKACLVYGQMNERPGAVRLRVHCPPSPWRSTSETRAALRRQHLPLHAGGKRGSRSPGAASAVEDEPTLSDNGECRRGSLPQRTGVHHVHPGRRRAGGLTSPTRTVFTHLDATAVVNRGEGAHPRWSHHSSVLYPTTSGRSTTTWPRPCFKPSSGSTSFPRIQATVARGGSSASSASGSLLPSSYRLAARHVKRADTWRFHRSSAACDALPEQAFRAERDEVREKAKKGGADNEACLSRSSSPLLYGIISRQPRIAVVPTTRGEMGVLAERPRWSCTRGARDFRGVGGEKCGAGLVEVLDSAVRLFVACAQGPGARLTGRYKDYC